MAARRERATHLPPDFPAGRARLQSRQRIPQASHQIRRRAGLRLEEVHPLSTCVFGVRASVARKRVGQADRQRWEQVWQGEARGGYLYVTAELAGG